MSILYDKQAKTFTLQTNETSYQMQVDQCNRLRHLYYGRRVDGECMDRLYLPADRGGFSPDYYETALHRGAACPDILPQEYTRFNVGDFRLSCLEVTAEGGPLGADFHYTGYQIMRGKYALDGLPAAHGTEDEAETLTILLEDPILGLGLELLYGVFEQQDMITRAARLINLGKRNIILDKAASMCLDIPFGTWELLHFHGRHAMERQPERRPLLNGIQTVASKRGASSHHHNPFAILCDSQTNEDAGNCFGAMPVYSGSYRIDVELDSLGLVRMVCGIHDELFRWILHPGESFTTPEVLLTFTHRGLTALSQRYHRFLRSNICRGKFIRTRRPVLINNWEATYFRFTKEKILSIAEQAAALGAEMLVLDDGWFGKRDDDHSGLGDWYVNEEKLPGGLDPLIEQIHALGMRFGLWIEPEMVCEDSDLYRTHPDWALSLPGRKPALGRCQLILDLSRDDVVDYLTDVFSKLLREHEIDYISGI